METKTMKIGLSNTDKQNMANQVAEETLKKLIPEFSESINYISGMFVIYNNVLYKFISDKNVGAWDSSKAESATLNDLINSINADLVDDTNSTHKFATLEQLNQIVTNATNINNLNSNKLDKVTTTTTVMQTYVKLDDGTNKMLDVHWNNIRDTIPIRDQTGNIRVALVPTNDIHATSKQFVESQFLTDAEMETLISEVF